jgi:hypothetical protein
MWSAWSSSHESGGGTGHARDRPTSESRPRSAKCRGRSALSSCGTWLSAHNEAILYARGRAADRGLAPSIIAHAGDGNYRPLAAIDRADLEAIQNFEGLHAELIADGSRVEVRQLQSTESGSGRNS